MNIVLAKYEHAQIIADIVSNSHKDVAEKFGITKSNNPKHSSFYNKERVLSDFERGEEYFLYNHKNEHVGCVAFEQANKDVGYLNRLSVLPAYREQGVGSALVHKIIDYGAKKGICEISIGTIAKHIELGRWYKRLGFIENGVKQFSHLPFDVLFMKYVISSKSL